jgi:hypothetical protein
MKPAAIDVVHRRTCRHCGDPIEWASTEATRRSVELTLDTDTGDIVLTGDIRETARGNVYVARYVRAGTGTHRVHDCDWVPTGPDDSVEAWELEIQRDPDNPDDVTAAEVT